MKVLIINGFSRTGDGLRAFSRFESSIRQVRPIQAFRGQKNFSREELDFQIVDLHSIDQFLFETNSGFSNADSEKLFDHLDMVFIDGDASILPWFSKARKVQSRQFLIMIRMCKRTGKVMFASSFAMQMFAFLCATNIFVNRVVNGNGKGTLTSGFNSVPKSTRSHLEYGDLFLDNATGDLYGYDQAKEEFYPIANCAIHSHKAAQEDSNCYPGKARSSMLKSYRYVPQNFDDPDRIYVSQMNEASCRILKQYIQHWLSARLGVSATQYKEFVVPCQNRWDVHPVNSSDTDNIYKIFAESPRSPQVIMDKNAVCTQFHVDPRYPETVVLLENFVHHMCEKIYCEKQRLDVPLAAVTFQSFGRPTIKVSPAGAVVQSGHHSIAFNTAKHCGFSFSKRGGPVLVVNNATTATTVKAIQEKEDEDEESESSDQSSYSFTLSGKKKSTGYRQFDRKKTRKMLTTRQNTLKSEAKEESSAKTAWSTVTWSTQEIREFLHPGYPLEVMRNRPRTQGGVKSAANKSSLRFVFTPFHYCRYKEFSQMESTTASDSVPPPEKSLPPREDRKWVSGKDFRLVFPHQSRGDLRPPLNLEPLTPVTRHQFRESGGGSIWKL